MIARLHAIRFCVAILIVLLVHSGLAQSTEISDKRKSTTQQMKKEFSRLGVHKLYVPDFCDSGRVSGPGALFASIFSLGLKDAKDFTVLSRIDAHRFLIENHWTDCDLSNPDTLLKLSKEFGVDSILAGTLVPAERTFSIGFVLHDLSGKELARFSYSEPFHAQTIGMFPAISAASGWPFVLPGYDGVSLPRAIRMTSPPYTDQARAAHASGTIAISAIVTTEGKVEQARVVQKVDPGLDKLSLDTASMWTFEPAKGPDGTLVPVRVVFEINFALYQ